MVFGIFYLSSSRRFSVVCSVSFYYYICEDVPIRRAQDQFYHRKGGYNEKTIHACVWILELVLFALVRKKVLFRMVFISLDASAWCSILLRGYCSSEVSPVFISAGGWVKRIPWAVPSSWGTPPRSSMRGSCRLCRGDRKLRTYSVGVLILFSDQMAPEISEILKPIRVFEDSAISIRAFTDNSIWGYCIFIHVSRL